MALESPFDTSTSHSLPPSRVTRSSVRLAAAAAAAANPTAVGATNTSPTDQQTPGRPNKRKAGALTEPSTDQKVNEGNTTPARRVKKAKVTGTRASPPNPATSRARAPKDPAAMAKPGSSSELAGEKLSPTSPTPETSRRKSGRSKKTGLDTEPSNSTATTSSRRANKKSSSKKAEGTPAKNADEPSPSHSKRAPSIPVPGSPPANPNADDESHEGRAYDHDEEDDGEESWRSGLFGGKDTTASIASELRRYSSMSSNVPSQLRSIMSSLKQKDDPLGQKFALEQLSNLLLISTEDNLAGHFSPDQFITELVNLSKPSETGADNSEMTILACRCIANLMEALPPSTANVVYGGAVPVLCAQLRNVMFIDGAEQALSALEKISVEFPSSIVREGGLTSCLEYIDFFATSTQRAAVNTAANCCRNIPQDSFPVVKGVMSTLLGVLNNSDQKVVEKACVCVCRVVESFKYHQDKLEELVQPDLLGAIRRLLLPGTTNLIGPNIHTQFLRVLSITARASPKRSADMFQMDIVDTLYQVLTGVSPPTDLDNIASQIDDVLIMQALIHRPREQIFEALNVICELLPNVRKDGPLDQEDLVDLAFEGDDPLGMRNPLTENPRNSDRLKMLKDCSKELKRFAIVLLPTLTSAFSSTVNLGVRQKVLTAQLKMLSNLDVPILENALRTVQYASFLASILSQQDHPSLVLSALQAANLLLTRMERIYRHQFYREGVMAEISKLASQPLKNSETKGKSGKSHLGPEAAKSASIGDKEDLSEPSGGVPQDSESSDSDADRDDDDQEPDDDDQPVIHEDVSSSPSESSSDDEEYSSPRLTTSLQDCITLRAKKFLETHESSKGNKMREKASDDLETLRTLAQDIASCYLAGGPGDGGDLFGRLSQYFQGDALESITSAELINSEIGSVLLDIFSNSNDGLRSRARAAFIHVFMNSPAKGKTRASTATNSSTPFSVLVHKLQDVLSRSEHFEVVTVHQNALDSGRSSATSMIAKQMRLRLIAGDESEIPKAYRNIMISVHAIATFKTLDDYLRPRISLAERPKIPRNRDREGMSDGLSQTLAALAGLPRPTPRPAGRSDGTGDPSAPSTPSTAKPASRTRKAAKAKPSTPASNAKEKASAPRRSSRKHQDSAKGTSATPTQPPEQEMTQSPLECADERQLTDEDDIDDSSALDALVEQLESSMDEEEMPDPTAVNVEVAATGKITARKEDGTRVATPSQGSMSSLQNLHSSRAQQLLAAGMHPSLANRAMSYAAAIQAVPQDWHLEFSIDEQSISPETTVYRAVHYNNPQSNDASMRNVWSSVHPIKFRRVSGPPPPEASTFSQAQEASTAAEDTYMPNSLHEQPTTSTILRLLNILHELNSNLDDVLDDNKDIIKAEPLAQFVNTKLTAKLNRQLEEPLIVASRCLPPWSEDLPRLYPFLFPFETRHLFLQSTSFGYSRSMTRWQNAQSIDDSRRDRHHDDRPYVGRLQRQKVRISRTRILESAIKVMELYGASPSVLEVEYFEEVGTGLGPTLEFYSTVSKEFSRKELKLWRENESAEDSKYVFSKLGLFPAPMSEAQAETESGKKILQYFRILGKFIARSMLDSRIIDVPLNPTFFRVGTKPDTVPLSLGAVKTVDEHLAKSLKLVKQFATEKEKIEMDARIPDTKKLSAIKNIRIGGARIDDLSLDFTVPGYAAIELVPDGANVPVTIENVHSYVDKVLDMGLGSGVQRQIDAFRAGFSQVFSYTALKAFTPNELVMLFGQVEEDWSLETLLDSIKADHGYNMDSKSVRNLLQVMSELSTQQKRDFLQFVTGSPKLPIGGFKCLTPMFTVVCKPSEPPYTSDDFLISVMTCANYVKLPDYSNIDVLRRRLLTAIQEGQGAFHLS